MPTEKKSLKSGGSVMLYNECSIGFLRKCRILKLKDDEDEDEEGCIPLATAKLQNVEKEIRRSH